MESISAKTFTRFNDALVELYAADRRDTLVQVLLTHIPRLVGMDTCAFFPLGEDQWQYLDVVSPALDPSLFTRYKAYYEAYDDYKRAVFSVRPLPTIDRSSDYMDYRSWAMNPHRAEFLLPNGMYHLAGMQLFLRGMMVGDLSFHRDIGPDFTDLEMLLLRELQRHTAQALARCPVPDGRERRGTACPAQKSCGLSSREYEIAVLVAQGLRTREIAARLVISQNTVKTHIKHLHAKTGCRTRAELVHSLFGGQAAQGHGA